MNLLRLYAVFHRGHLLSWVAVLFFCRIVLGNDVQKSSNEKIVIELRSPSDIPVTGGKTDFSKEIIAVENQSFSQALRLRINTGISTKSCRCEITATNRAVIEKGNKLLIQFHARAKEGGTIGGGAVGVFFGNPKSPRTESVNSTFYIGNAWQKMRVACVARENYPPDKGVLSICLGSKAQVIEIGEITVTDLGKAVSIESLPQTRIIYKGQKPDAPWRQAASERIEKYRKADLSVSVRFGNGYPAEAAKVYVKMKRHAFGFGATISSYMINEQGWNGKKYRETLLKLFNKTVFENELKWTSWERSTNHQAVFKAAEWLLQNNLPIRGHHLISAAWPGVPQQINALKNNPNALRKKAEERILEMAAAWKGKLVEWDVLNEPHINRDIIELLGQEVTVDWFKLAHEADPKARLYVNDFGIFDDSPAVQDFYEDFIRFLLSHRAPIHGIGIQGHYDNNPTPPEILFQDIDRLAALGLPILISEHSINSTDEIFQADYTRDFVTTAFSHPEVVGILFWGFWAGDHFKPNAAYFREDWSIKPAGKMLMDLILKEWSTDLVERTDEKGQCKTRAFLGDYEITVQSSGRSKTISTNLPKDGRALEIELD